VSTEFGGLYGNGNYGGYGNEAGEVLKSQVLTMQVDLNKGTLKFWVDGISHGPGFARGVTGPVQWAVSMYGAGNTVQIVPTPELEPWKEWVPPDNDDY
jgi:hypothetical protein